MVTWRFFLSCSMLWSEWKCSVTIILWKIKRDDVDIIKGKKITQVGLCLWIYHPSKYRPWFSSDCSFYSCRGVRETSILYEGLFFRMASPVPSRPISPRTKSDAVREPPWGRRRRILQDKVSRSSLANGLRVRFPRRHRHLCGTSHSPRGIFPLLFHLRRKQNSRPPRERIPGCGSRSDVWTRSGHCSAVGLHPMPDCSVQTAWAVALLGSQTACGERNRIQYDSFYPHSSE